MKHETIISDDRVYRYVLWRESNNIFYDKDGYVCFIGLNPSTADEVKNDPTIRRCMGFVDRWRYKTLCMVNLFAYRTTDPVNLMAANDPVGPDNDKWIRDCTRNAALVIAAWGFNGEILDRGKTVEKMIPNLYCLGKTKEGYPKHPLYVPYSVEPQIYIMDESNEHKCEFQQTGGCYLTNPPVYVFKCRICGKKAEVMFDSPELPVYTDEELNKLGRRIL